MRVSRNIIQGNGLDKYIQAQFDKYQIRVGILENKRHFAPARGDHTMNKGQKVWYNYQGLNLLKPSTFRVDGTLYGIAKQLDKSYKWLRKPWTSKNNAAVLTVINYIVDNMNGKDAKQRLINAAQAVVRNPLLRGDYGKNSPKRAKEKGFNKLMFATGQFFRNIRARLD